MDRGAWWAGIHGVTKSQTPLNMHAHFLTEIKFSLKVYNFSTSIFAQLSKHHHHLITGQSHPSERKP